MIDLFESKREFFKLTTQKGIEQNAKRLEPIFNEWRKRFGLTDHWFFEAIMIAVMIVGKKLHPEVNVSVPAFKDLSELVSQLRRNKEERLKPQRLITDFGDYRPSMSYRREFFADARKKFEAELHRYCDGRERQAAKMGWRKAPEKRGLNRYLWLAGYHVLGWASARIAEVEDKKSRRTVEEQIKDLACEIGLTLRDHKAYDKTQSEEIIAETLMSARKAMQYLLPEDPELLHPALMQLAPPLIKRLLR
jgi:hypothetical protein